MRAVPIVAILTLSLVGPLANAQLVLDRAPFQLTTEGYANVTAARNQGEDNIADAKRYAARADAGLRLLGLVGDAKQIRFGARVELLSTKEDNFAVGERSLLALGPWGRVELGKRRGLPDVLSGYAPNGYTFTSAEFGVASGRTLDPGGDLPTSFLAPGLAAQINGISSLGFAATFFGDRSGKLIYVSPKLSGFEGGVSYSPRAEDLGGRFKHLLQTGLTHETYFGEHVLRVGGTYTQAAGSTAGGKAFDDLKSFSGGATLVLSNELYLGASATYDGHSGLQRVADPSFKSSALGYAASVNYNSGPWTVGSYYQQAKAEGDPTRAGRDELRAWQVGASYRLSTKIRLYGAYYRYRFNNEGGLSDSDRFNGGVLLFGTRIAL